MASIKKGKLVTIHYIGKLEDDTIFDSTEGKDPLQFTMGEGEILPAFEEQIMEMAVGEKKRFTLSVEEAYGEKRDDLIIAIPRSTLPKDLEPQVGILLEIGRPGEPTTVAEIVAVDSDTIKIDVNHPLCGKELTFDVEIVEIS